MATLDELRESETAEEFLIRIADMTDFEMVKEVMAMLTALRHDVDMWARIILDYPDHAKVVAEHMIEAVKEEKPKLRLVKR